MMLDKTNKKKENKGKEIGKKLVEKRIATNYIKVFNMPTQQNSIGIYIKRKYDIKKIGEQIRERYGFKTRIKYSIYDDEVDLLELKININD